MAKDGFRKIQRPSGPIWEYRVSLGVGLDGKTKRKSFYGKTQAICRRKYDDFMQGKDDKISNVATVKEWAEQWLEIYKKPNVTYGTYHNYKMYVDNRIVPSIGHLKLAQIKPAHISEFMSTVSKLSNSAQHHIYLTLKGIFDTAVENGFIKTSPMPKFMPKNQSESTIEVFGKDELKKLIDTAKNHKYGLLVLLPLYTGMRMGEIIALKWTDVNFKNKTITIRKSMARAEDGGYAEKSPKSGKERIIVMPNELTAILKNTPKRGIYVITGDKEPFITQNQYELRYKQVLQAADVRYLSPHKCRHTYATYLVRGGADLPTIQALLGHAELSTTEIYIDIDISDKQKNIKKLKYK